MTDILYAAPASQEWVQLYVEGQLQPLRKRIAELEELTEQQAEDLKKVAYRARTGLPYGLPGPF